jgi:phage virion morphogenesis protein
MVMGTIAEAMHAAVMDSFENQESPDGEKWEPSMRTLIEGGKTLIDRGILKNSLHPHHTRDSAEVGTNIVYAAVHQFGSDFSIRSNRRRVTLPARPYLGFSLDLVNEIEETLLDLLRA